MDERGSLLLELQQTIGRKRKVIPNSVRYLNSHLCPKIHVLLSLMDIDKSLCGIARMIGATKDQTRGALKILEETGAAVEESGQWRAHGDVFEVEEDIGNIGIQSFHKKSLHKAIESIDLDPRLRFFQSVYLTIAEDELEDLIKEVSQFNERLVNRFYTPRGVGKKLYQFNFNSIPVSDSLIHSSKASECAKEIPMGPTIKGDSHETNF